MKRKLLTFTLSSILPVSFLSSCSQKISVSKVEFNKPTSWIENNSERDFSKRSKSFSY